jgi:hypothetical protein
VNSPTPLRVETICTSQSDASSDGKGPQTREFSSREVGGWLRTRSTIPSNASTIAFTSFTELTVSTRRPDAPGGASSMSPGVVVVVSPSTSSGDDVASYRTRSSSADGQRVEELRVLEEETVGDRIETTDEEEKHGQNLYPRETRPSVSPKIC